MNSIESNFNSIYICYVAFHKFALLASLLKNILAKYILMLITKITILKEKIFNNAIPNAIFVKFGGPMVLQSPWNRKIRI